MLGSASCFSFYVLLAVMCVGKGGGFEASWILVQMQALPLAYSMTMKSSSLGFNVLSNGVEDISLGGF